MKHFVVLSLLLISSPCVAKMVLVETLEGESQVPLKAGWVSGGKFFSKRHRHLSFLDERNREFRRINLDTARTRREDEGVGKIIERIEMDARISRDSRHALQFENTVVMPDDPEAEDPVSVKCRVSYVDATAAILWSRLDMSCGQHSIAISSDGSRIGLVVAFSDEMSSHTVIILNSKGIELRRFPDSGLDVVLSPSGEFGISARTCFSVSSGQIHRMEAAPGFMGITDDGVCQVRHYLPEHDDAGRQQTELLEEYRFPG